KWTRSIVLEECDEAGLNATGGRKLEPRRSRSVDKQGVPLGDPACNVTEATVDTIQYGLGWFPGYAINLETGERLNIAFGEDSYQINDNGNDMMWNPTNTISTPTYSYAFGGRHYIYVFGNSRGDSKYSSAPASFAPAAIKGLKMGTGNYSNFANFAKLYKYEYQMYAAGNTNQRNSAKLALANLWSDAMWVNIPLTTEASHNFKDPAN